MKNIWHYNKTGSKHVSDVHGRKVTHVVQHKRTANLGYCYWTGELDNDNYFMIQVLDGVVFLTVGERECELKTKDYIAVAYVDDIKRIIDEPNDLYRMRDLLVAKTDFLPKFMAELTFEEIMGIFMWEYASPTVEVYEHILV
jgi:hypothetical protein